MAGRPNVSDIFQSPEDRHERHEEVIQMDSYNGSNYENASMPRESSHHYRKRGGLEGTRDTQQEDDPDDLDNLLPSRQRSTKLRSTASGKSHKGHRKSFFGTVRLRNVETLDNDERDELINGLAKEFTEAEDDDNEAMEKLKKYPLSIKKPVWDKVQAARNREKKQNPPNAVVQFYYRIAVNWQILKGKMADVLYSMELWKASLKAIEGNFGTGVTSYFLFLKWLFLFNIPTFLLIFLFVVIPQLLWHVRDKNSSFYMASDASFTGVELLSGGDWFKRTELYFGSYTNHTVNLIGDAKYSMRFAYLLTCAGFYVITLLVLAYSLVKSYKIHFIEGGQSNQLYYVAKVLCGWDFTVTEEATCISHHTALSKELQEYLAAFLKVKKHKTCQQWCGMIFLRLVINIAVVAALAGLGYLVWVVAPLTEEALQGDEKSTGGNFLKDITTPLVISAINLIVPFLFSYLASVENYHNPWVDIFLTMLRTITLNIVTLGALLVYWFISSDISCTKRYTSTTSENTTLSMANVTSAPADVTESPLNGSCISCWENFVGQQFYCLVIIDFIFIILGTLCSEFLYKKIQVGITGDEKKAPEFNIGRNTLNLIYSQALVWLGVYYCPFLPLIMIVKLLVLFYIKKVSVMYNCRPSEKSWRGGRTYAIILLLLFVTFLLCFIAISYSIAFMSSSQDCGPFYGYNTSYAVITEAVDTWQKAHKSGFASAIVEILTSAAFYITIFMIVCAIAYYTRLVSKGRKEVVARLRKQIQMEGKDKNFLKKVADHVRNKGATAGGPRQRVTHTPSGAGRPQENGGVRGQRENNNNPTGMYEPTDRAPQGRPYTQVTPAEVTNPGYRDQSPTRKPDLPYFAGQQYPANM